MVRIIIAVFFSLTCGHSLNAQERGPVTNLPMPRYVSLKAEQANVRRGPGTNHRIDWVFKRRNMPLQIIAEFSHWRKVKDRDGAGGWVHYTLLSGVRTVIVEKDMAPLYARANTDAQINAYVEAGVVARLDECVPNWCRIIANGQDGWAETGVLWGITPDEGR